MYADTYSLEIVRKLKKLRQKDVIHFQKLRAKIDAIRDNPNASYKFLHYNFKGFQRVHIGHFVLIFQIDHNKREISFEDYDHHDKIYLR